MGFWCFSSVARGELLPSVVDDMGFARFLRMALDVWDVDVDRRRREAVC